MVEDGGNAKAKSAPGRETRRSISIKAEKKSIKRNCTRGECNVMQKFFGIAKVRGL